MPETHVIELKDGEATKIEFQVGAHRTQIEAEPRFREQEPADYPGPHVCIHRTERDHKFETHVGNVPLAADPERAAVLKERKRCKAAVTRAWVDEENNPSFLPAILLAIDAPPEPKSEYHRGYREGQEAMQECAVAYLYGVAEARANDTESAAVSLIRGSAEWINDWATTEPAR